MIVVMMVLMPVLRRFRLALACGDLPGAKDDLGRSFVERQHEANRQHAARDEQRQQQGEELQATRTHTLGAMFPDDGRL